MLFFRIVLSENIWIQQYIFASVMIGTTALGVVLCPFTVGASLQSLNCPFQTWVSTVLKHAFGVVSRPVGCLQSRPSDRDPQANFLDRLPEWHAKLKGCLQTCTGSDYQTGSTECARMLFIFQQPLDVSLLSARGRVTQKAYA